MERVKNFLNQTGNKILDFVEHILAFFSGKKEKTSSPEKDLKVAKGEIEPRQDDLKEIKFGSREFLVECVSCKTVHELSAICIACGQPVCTDTIYCRKTIYNEQLDDYVIYCTDCAAS